MQGIQGTTIHEALVRHLVSPDKLAYTDFLALLLQDEIARRSHKKLAVRIRRASFRNQKTLEDFDFSFNPKLNRALILDLATGPLYRREGRGAHHRSHGHR